MQRKQTMAVMSPSSVYNPKYFNRYVDIVSIFILQSERSHQNHICVYDMDLTIEKPSSIDNRG